MDGLAYRYYRVHEIGGNSCSYLVEVDDTWLIIGMHVVQGRDIHVSEAGQETSGASSTVLPQHSPHKGRGRATPPDEVKTPLYFSLFTPVPPFTSFELFARSTSTGLPVYLLAMNLRATDPTLA